MRRDFVDLHVKDVAKVINHTAAANGLLRLTADAIYLCQLAKKAADELIDYTSFNRLKNLILWLHSKLELGQQRDSKRKITINQNL